MATKKDKQQPQAEKQAGFAPVLPHVEVVKVADLKPHPRNYRKHPDDQLDHIIESIRTNGIYRNVVIAKDGTVLAGHGVLQAAQKAGFAELPAIRLPFAPDSAPALKVLTGDNEIGHLGEVDDRQLTELLKEIQQTDLSGLGLLGTGYDEMMLANLLYITRPASEIEEKKDAAQWVGMPEYEDGGEPYRIVISFENLDDRDRYIREYGLRIDYGSTKGKTWSTRWPFTERIDAAAVRVMPPSESKEG